MILEEKKRTVMAFTRLTRKVPEKSLTEIIHQELGSLLESCQVSYSTFLDDHLTFVDKSERTRTEKDIRKLIKNMDYANREYHSITADETPAFSAENFARLSKAFRKIDDNLPTPEKTGELCDRVIENEIRNPEGIILHLYNMSAVPIISNAIAGLAVHATMHETPALIASGIYYATAMTSFQIKRTRKSGIPSSLFAAAGNLAAASILGINYLITGEAPSGITLKALGAITLGVGLPGAFLAYQNQKSIRQTTRKIHDLFDSLDHSESFLTYGIAIEEANSNLSYVKRVCESEKRDIAEFQDQIDRLEETLKRYIDGEAIYADVHEARIRYIPKQSLKKMTGEEVSPVNRKKGYTPEEYQRLKESGAFDEYKAIMVDNPIDSHLSQSTLVLNQEQTSNVTLSDALNNLYLDKNGKIGGFSARKVIDLAQTKIPHGINSKPLSENTGGWQKLIQRVKTEYDIPEETRLFAMQPTSSLRCVYTRHGNDYHIVDIMTHHKYDFLCK